MSPSKRSGSHKPQDSTNINLAVWLPSLAIVALLLALVYVVSHNVRETEKQAQVFSEFAERIRKNCAYVGGGFHFDEGKRSSGPKWLSLFACPDGKLAIIPQ